MAVDVDQVVDRVRFLLGDPSLDIISDEVIISIVDSCILSLGVEGDDYCKVVQCSLMDTLRYLIRKAQVPSNSDGSEIKRRKEKRGNTEIELEFQVVSSSDNSSGWQDMYEDYQSHPEWICAELASKTSGKYLVTLGGTRVDESRKVLHDPNSNSAYNKCRVSRKFWNSSKRTKLNRRR